MAKDKKEKIEVDKDYFEMVNKAITDLQKQLNERDTILANLQEAIETLNQKFETTSQTKVATPSPKRKFTFWSGELTLGKPKTPAEVIQFQQRSEEFRKKLEQLMLEYDVIQLTAGLFMAQENGENKSY